MQRLEPDKYKMNMEFRLILQILRKALSADKGKTKFAQVGHVW